MYTCIFKRSCRSVALRCKNDFELQCKHLEKFKSNRATKNRRRKSKVFCMYGTVTLRPPIQTF